MGFYTDVRRYGNNILYRGVDEFGKRVQTKIPFKPELFVPSKNGTLTALDGETVERMEFGSLRDASDFVNTYKDVANFKIYGNRNFVSQYIAANYPGHINYDSKLVYVANIDIEVNADQFPNPESALYPITCITVKNSLTNEYHVFEYNGLDASKARKVNGTVVHHDCFDEADLLDSLLKYFEKDYPDIITGWNIRLFDIPYIINRTKRILGDESISRLSPWNKVVYREISVKGKDLDAYEIWGIAQLDYLDLFQKFAFSYGPQESYRLDHIANVVLNERKLSYEEFEGLTDLYEHDYQRYVDYNIKDVELVDRIDEKCNLIDLAMMMAYRGGVNYNDVFGTTHIWETIIYRALRAKDIPTPPKKISSKMSFVGGYVKDPHVGMHDWVVSLDVNSMYPNIIVQWNMSPETIVNDVPMTDANVESMLDGQINDVAGTTMTANGAHFRRDKQGIIPEIIVKYYSDRKEIKGKMLDAEKRLEATPKDNKTLRASIEREVIQYKNAQQAVKILLNSLFGAVGNAYFQFTDIRMAEGITTTGQFLIRASERVTNRYMNSILGTGDSDYVIAIDTDSNFINFGPLVKKFALKNPLPAIDKMCEDKFVPNIQNEFDRIFKQCNCFVPRLVMGRDVIADRGVWTAKKRYILNMLNKEGVSYEKPKLKIMGIEAIKSSTPAACRKALKDMFSTIMSGSREKTQQAIAEFESAFMKLNPEDVSFPRGVSDVDKHVSSTKPYYKSGTPIHVRGAILYNRLIGKDSRFAKIQNGDKIKFCYLKMPNPIRENVIAFTEYLPQEFGLHAYVDYQMQFEKTFLNVIQPILDAIGWHYKEVSTLDAFFG